MIVARLAHRRPPPMTHCASMPVLEGSTPLSAACRQYPVRGSALGPIAIVGEVPQGPKVLSSGLPLVALGCGEPPWYRGRIPHRWRPQAPPWPGQVCGWPSEGMAGPGQLRMRLSSSDTEDRRRRRACRSVMVESPVTAPGSDALLATKLHMPGPRPGMVPRSRLTACLDEGLARGLVLVCGRPGTARRSCWPTGPGAASSRPRGCRWMVETTTRPGSGTTRWPRWTGPAQGPANGWRRCSARPRRRRSRAWSRR